MDSHNRLKESNSIVMLTADRKIDRRIMLEADTLEAAGWKVIIIAMPLAPNEMDTDPRIVRIDVGNALKNRTKFLLHAYRWLCRRVPQTGWLIREMKAIAWRYVVDQESFFVKLFSSATSRFSPDIFVAHDLPMLPVARLACQRSGAKLVYDSHELYSEQELSLREKQRWAEIEAKHIGACDAVVTVNQSIAEELERRYGLHGVNVIYNAERSRRSLERKGFFHRAFELCPDQKVILFQGGLLAGRNLEVLVEAMGHVRNPKLNLVILGDGQLGAPLKKLVEKLGLSDRVYLHPEVRQEHLLSFTASADAGVIPYQPNCLNNYYCTPNKLFEFIAAGVPIVASDLPELRRMIQTHGIGLVGDMSTAEKTARLIDDFFGDSGRLQGWQRQALISLQTVCWEEEEKKLVSIYEHLRN
jgi:glycosyltransferase involved in cell wall biosynthesis